MHTIATYPRLANDYDPERVARAKADMAAGVYDRPLTDAQADRLLDVIRASNAERDRLASDLYRRQRHALNLHADEYGDAGYAWPGFDDLGPKGVA